MRPIFLDCETTGLDPERHEVWEVGLIVDDEEYLYRFEPQRLADAEPDALRVNRFYERYFEIDWMPVASAVKEICEVTAGRTIAGVVPSFDAAFLGRLIRQKGYQQAWNYHLLDVVSFGAGWLAGRLEAGSLREPPWSSSDLAVQLGIDSSEFERHTALGDARWAEAIYDAIVGKRKEGDVGATANA